MAEGMRSFFGFQWMQWITIIEPRLYKSMNDHFEIRSREHTWFLICSSHDWMTFVTCFSYERSPSNITPRILAQVWHLQTGSQEVFVSGTDFGLCFHLAGESFGTSSRKDKNWWLPSSLFFMGHKIACHPHNYMSPCMSQNNRRPRMEPWGTPQGRGATEEEASPWLKIQHQL